jgi:hypothetical protein
MPLTGLTLEEVLWTLPAAIAYQFQLVYLQTQGHRIVAERPFEEARILERLRRANG